MPKPDALPDRRQEMADLLTRLWEYKCVVNEPPYFCNDEISRGGVMWIDAEPFDAGVQATIRAFRLWSETLDEKQEHHLTVLPGPVKWGTSTSGILFTKNGMHFNYRYSNGGTEDGETEDIFKFEEKLAVLPWRVYSP